MRNELFLLFSAFMATFLFAGCGIFEDLDVGNDTAIVGGGAIAGKDYVCGLEPSDDARDYFDRLSDDAPIETVRRTGENESTSGVKFVNNGGVLIPPGVMISFDNQGYCMDPHLPASKDGEEFQLIPMSSLIPSELQGTYKNLIAQEAAGNTAVRSNMQHLVWALRTAGTDAAYANNLTPQQKQILNQCSDGLFELFHEKEKAGNKIMNDLLGMADSVLNVSIGGVTYKASDLLDPDIANKKIEEHLNQLIDLSEYLPVENVGLNYGEIEPGIYIDVRGTGYLQFHAKIANATSQPFIFYPSDYVGQVGNPAKSSGLLAAADSSMRQRVTTLPQDVIIAHGNGTCPNPIETKTIDWKNLWGNFESFDDAKFVFERQLPEDAATDDCKEYFALIIKKDGLYHLTRIDSATLSSIEVDGEKNNAFKISFSGLSVDDDVVAIIHSHPNGDNRYSKGDKKTIKQLNQILKRFRKKTSKDVLV